MTASRRATSAVRSRRAAMPTSTSHNGKVTCIGTSVLDAAHALALVGHVQVEERVLALLLPGDQVGEVDPAQGHERAVDEGRPRQARARLVTDEVVEGAGRLELRGVV